MVSGVAVSSAKVAATSAAAELVGVVVAGDSITLTGSKRKKWDGHTHTEKRDVDGKKSIPVVAVGWTTRTVVDDSLVGCWSSPGADEKSKSKVSRSESPGCKMTLACSEELIKEQADGLAHRGGFWRGKKRKRNQINRTRTTDESAKQTDKDFVPLYSARYCQYWTFQAAGWAE